MAAGYLVVLLCISPWLLFVALGIGAALTAMQRLALPRLRSAAGQVMRSQVDIVTAMTDDLMGLRLLHSYGQLDQAQGALERRSASLEDGLRRRARLINLIPPISSLLPLVCITILVALSVVLFQNRSTGVMPSLITFVLGLQRLNVRLTSLATSVSVVVDNLPILARIDAVLSTEDKQFVRRGGVAFTGLADAIRFDCVGLTYPSCEEPVLHDLSFTIPKGSTTALVGSSGAGKSSIADLLIGLYAPTQGTIFIDAVDLQQIDPQSWQQRLGVVNQDSFLFNRTIADNIAFGSPGASYEAIVRAATMAHADGFIHQLPDGFDTRVGERGFRLSGGQRQRIALARALLRQPQLLILDEATSALDTENEFLVQEALRELDHSFTRLVIAHRLATVVDADQILVIDRGRIVQRGTHAQLSLEDSGTYRKLLLRQALSDRSLQLG
jgi:ATP-binding cassette subfamily B protein/subfamily B ATP-binding cassette protein MsbA